MSKELLGSRHRFMEHTHTHTLSLMCICIYILLTVGRMITNGSKVKYKTANPQTQK